MTSIIFADRALGVLERALDVRLARHGVLAGNAANADTPGFVPSDLDFAAAMREADGRPPRLILGPAATPGLDGNLVDLDRTLVELAENALQYNAAARAAGKKLAILRYVASDGNG